MTRITDPFVFDQPGGPEEGWSIMARVGFSGEMQAPVDGTFSGLELLFELSLDDGPRQETMHLNAGVGDEYGVSLTYAPFVHFARNGVEIPAQEILAEVSSYYLSEHEWSQPTPVGLEFDQGLAFDVVCYLDDTVSSAALYTTDITRAHDAIPEPATLWLLALGAVASRGFRRR
ncbi:MAG TPA: PEP-CTERM sorting domain-containing protein [Phycisphaerae bacterium]|nr:PEP-CTERM sorting domain-containing protein [Phycisphaerae bacterium]